MLGIKLALSENVAVNVTVLTASFARESKIWLTQDLSQMSQSPKLLHSHIMPGVASNSPGISARPYRKDHTSGKDDVSNRKNMCSSLPCIQERVEE